MPLQSLDQKSDAWLVAAIASSDKRDQDAATDQILETHAPQLRAYMRKKLPAAWAEDALNDTWAAFYEALKSGAFPDSIGAYLGGIARHKRADKVTFLAKEDKLEEDEPDFEDGDGVENEESDEESERDAMRDYLVALPYGGSLLTPCQRMLWALTSQHNLPIATASRILGKSSETLHTHISAARKAVKKHVKASDLDPKVWEDNPFPTSNQNVPDDAVIIENFSSWFLPRLTEDEAAPLGLPLDELAEHYSALLMVPRWKAEEGSETEYGELDLLLLRNEDHDQWYKEVTRIQRRPHGKSFRFPEACQIALNIEDGYLNLEVMSLISMIPDLDAAEHSDNTWLAVHKVPTLVPVIYGEISEGLYDDLEYFGDDTAWGRWPFAMPFAE